MNPKTYILVFRSLRAMQFDMKVRVDETIPVSGCANNRLRRKSKESKGHDEVRVGEDIDRRSHMSIFCSSGSSIYIFQTSFISSSLAVMMFTIACMSIFTIEKPVADI